MAKSNNLVPLKSIMVARDGKRVSPPLNKAFPFTDEEIKVLKEGVDYRKAVNEDEEADLASVMAERNSPHVARAKTNAQGAGNTSAMRDGLDGTSATGESGSDADQRLSIADIEAGIADLDNDAITAALNAERGHAKPRVGAIKLYEAEIEKRAKPPVDDDL